MNRTFNAARSTAALLLAAALLVPTAAVAKRATLCMGLTATIVGTPGDDILSGTSGADVIHGLGGDDIITAKGGKDTVCGGSGSDSISGGRGDDAVRGGPGADTMNGGYGNDTIDGGAGRDVVKYSYRGGEGVGVSLVSNLTQPVDPQSQADADSLASIENIIGTQGPDVLVGNDGPNVIAGRGGNDEIIPLRGSDDIDGGAGFDWVEYFPNNRGVFVDLETGIATGSGQDTVQNAEAVWGTDFDDELAGNGADNYLYGADGDDDLRGRAGIDQLEPGMGQDTLAGGTGKDWVLYVAETSGVDIDLAAGLATGAGSDSLLSVESARGTSHGDTIVGDDSTNYLIGGAGNDTLRGRAGHDNIDPGTGNDHVRGGSGVDWVYYWAHSAGVDIDLAAGVADGSGADTLESIEAAVGTNHDDTIVGNASANSLWGYAGNDEVRGRGGNDYVQAAGGGTNDLFGGPGHDLLRFNLYDSPITFDLRTGVSSDGGSDDFSGFEGAWGTRHNDSLTGDDADNTFRGLAGDDQIVGGGGDDYLDGDAGTDTIAGGPGTDVCVSGEDNSGCETIMAEDALGSAEMVPTAVLSVARPTYQRAFVDFLLGGRR